jgi:Secretion system C-terminal sorting domain/FG-GAP-like repeat
MKQFLLFNLVLFLTFSVHAQEWIEHTVNEYFEGASSVYPVDFDGDGDIDLLGCAANYEYGNIHWWENVGGHGLSWNEHVISSTAMASNRVFAADVDGDGDQDALAAIWYTDEIIWWENEDGNGLSWIEHIVDGDFDFALDVHAEDVDGDGDTDVLGAGRDENSITWWENVNGDGLIWIEHAVSGFFEGASSVYPSDVNGDGNIDIVGAANQAHDVTWWENLDGDGLSWTEHAIDDFVEGVADVYAIDVDGDGDSDVFGAAYIADNLAWWENVDGDGLSWVEHTVGDALDGVYSIFAADMDGDEDTDVLSAAYFADDITWWENVDGDGITWIEQTLDGNFDEAMSVRASDVDGDGDIDVLGAAKGAHDITWWEQPGEPPVVVSLVPISAVDLPATGGILTFDASVRSNLPGTYPDATFWTKVKLPNGEFYPQVLFEFTFTLQPFMNASGNFTQEIPDYAPAGNYEMWGWVGQSPDSDPRFGGFFPFTKSSTMTDGSGVNNWASCGHIIADEAANVTTLPTVYGMNPIYPNPFNASTTITVTLPESADLTVNVYNVTGQQVAELANRQYSAGSHNLTFDASGMASGLYFVRATVPGQMDQVQKVMLVR